MLHNVTFGRNQRERPNDYFVLYLKDMDTSTKKHDGRESTIQESPWPYNTNTKTPIPEREDSGVVISVPPVSHCSFRNETEEYLLLSERTFVSFISKNE